MAEHIGNISKAMLRDQDAALKAKKIKKDVKKEVELKLHPTKDLLRQLVTALSQNSSDKQTYSPIVYLGNVVRF